MKYNGIELKEITEPQIFDPPKKMFVLNNALQEFAQCGAVILRIMEKIDKEME